MSVVVTSRVKRTAGGRGGARGWMAYVMGHDAERSAAYRSDLGDPAATVAVIEALIHPTKRTTEAVSVVHSFSSSELDSSSPDDVQAAVDVTYEMLRRASPTEPVVVVAHTDSKGGFLHVHGLVVNHNLETGKANSNALMHWQIRAVNDELMAEIGLEVVQHQELAHDRSHALARHRGEPVPTEDQAAALTISKLDTKTWRAWMARRLDELVWDDRVTDIDTLTDIASEIGISIRQQAATKRSGGLPTLTYALVDDAGEVRRDGRRRLAGSQSKIGDAYTYRGLTETLATAAQYKEKERRIHEQSSHEAQAAAEAEQRAIDDALGGLHVAAVRAEPAYTPVIEQPVTEQPRAQPGAGAATPDCDGPRRSGPRRQPDELEPGVAEPAIEDTGGDGELEAAVAAAQRRLREQHLRVRERDDAGDARGAVPGAVQAAQPADERNDRGREEPELGREIRPGSARKASTGDAAQRDSDVFRRLREHEGRSSRRRRSKEADFEFG